MGYGFPNQRLAQNLPCGLFQDLLLFFNSSDTTQTARVYVTGASTPQLALLTLGVLTDSHLLHEHNFAQQTLRNWKLSFSQPNGGNLVAVQYE